MIQLLIDGHNLIGQAPGLSLKDFDDEEQLVVMLRKHAARRGARITVVFDAGRPGGTSQTLSGGWVTVIFAADKHTTADRVLIERIREMKRPREWVLVSGDRAIQQEAQRRRMRVIESADFAASLTASPKSDDPGPNIDNKPDQEIDVKGWMEEFKKKK